LSQPFAVLHRTNIKFENCVGFRTDARESPALISTFSCVEGAMANLDSGYQPEELMLFRRLFEECIRGLPERKRTANNQARVARQLLDCAATGERNPVELRIAATTDGRKSGMMS
jgi:hypothetical protein